MLAPAALAADQPGSWQEGFDHMMWGGGFGLVGGLMMILFWGAVFVLIFVAARWISGDPSTGNRGRRDAIEILRERFASGEIDEEEFERRKKLLER